MNYFKSKNALPVKNVTIEASERGMIDVGGLCEVISFAEKLGFFRLIDKRLPLPQRSDGYYPSDFVKCFIALQFISRTDVTLDTLTILRDNHALKKALKMKEIPSASALGDFLRRMSYTEAQKTVPGHENETLVLRGGHADGLARMQDLFSEFSVLTLKRLGRNISNTLDVDAFVIEENKAYSAWTYKNKKGTMGYGGFFGGVCVMLELEPGNHSPHDNIAKRTESCIQLIKKAGLKVKQLREDAAGYVADIINYCDKNNILFFLRAANDPAVKKSIQTIQTKKEGEEISRIKEEMKMYWHEEEINICNNQTERITLGTAVHTMDKTENPFLLAVKRTEIIEDVKEETFFPEVKQTKHLHFAVATNATDKTEKEITEFYNQRAEDSENRNKELLIDFGAGTLHCGGEIGLAPNRVSAYIKGMVYNMMLIFKHECLEEEERKHRLPTLCDMFIRVPAKVTYHAHEVHIALPHYMKKVEKKLRKIQWKIKHIVKRVHIERYAPQYGQLIFRRDDDVPTPVALPDASIVLETACCLRL